jgi:hypothetical protein
VLRRLLSGGDRRMLAQANRVLALVRETQGRVRQLAALTKDADWLVSMRAMDVLEKLARERAAAVQPYKKLFIGALADSEEWEVRLQVVRALPLLSWTARERARVVDILLRDVNHPKKFVRAWALDSLATFARGNAALGKVVMLHLERFEASGSKALAARARSIRKRLHPSR